MDRPDFSTGVIDISKLRDYCLNPDHPLGKHKARRFHQALRLTRHDANWLKQQIIDGNQNTSPVATKTDPYGTRYVADIKIINFDKAVVVRTVWIVSKDSVRPRLISAYII